MKQIIYTWLLVAVALLQVERLAEAGENLPMPALQAPLASRAPLVAVARAGSRLVALGDEGVVLFSDDGKVWRQARQMPYDGLLTAACFTDARNGWAVGYGGVILSSADGGDTWQLRHRMEPAAVLLSIDCLSKNRVLAVGAYGTALQTRDGGKSWTPLAIGQGRDADLHLNAILASRQGTLIAAAEGGVAFRSADDGNTWSRVETPASGSLWGGLALHDGGVLLYGMSGRIVASNDDGRNWESLDSGTHEALTGATQLNDGRIIVVGNGGVVVVSTSGTRAFRAQVRPDRQGLSAVAASNAGALKVFGAQGVGDQDIARTEPEMSR